MNCPTCDLLIVAAKSESIEVMLTVSYKVASDLGLDAIKAAMCQTHRDRYAMSLLQGAKAMSEIPVRP